MGISSLGLGSSILTQDVIDQLRSADEAGQITPIDLNIANEKDKKDAIGLIDATMTNLIDSINELATPLVYDDRAVDVSGVSVEVTADSNTDVQDFTLDVVNIATKQIEQSGVFDSATATIASAAGSLNLNIDGQDFTIDYDATTTLTDLKNLINETASGKIDATIVQINSGEFQLFMSSVETGANQDISITDNNTPKKLDNKITNGLDAIQTGIDANFTFNGQAVTRSSNTIDDLIVGLDITLKSVGSSDVSVTQDRTGIMDKIDSFVEKYNAAMVQVDKMTKPSVDGDERGIFSGESSMKNMKRMLQEMISNVGEGSGSMFDYGFDIDKSGTLSVDKDVLGTKMDESSANVEAFFGGGTFTNPDDSTVELTGAFGEFSTLVEGYTKYNATIDQLKTSIVDRISTLDDKKSTATERLDAKYEIMAKQFAAYDLMISKINSASSMFTQMANAAADSNN